jgi:hypothetical protein
MANLNLIAVLALAGLGVLLLLYRGDNGAMRRDDRHGSARLRPDSSRAREDTRRAQVRAGDRVWEVASLHRDSANPERDRVLAASRL